jgi:hypothetical protein
MAEEPTCVTPLDFPHRPLNRPALDRIAYRIGAYPHFREAMMRSINQSLPLAGWTHRAPDDPGIALLEGAAILGDILTFYQEHYANEAWLRTARWRDSISDLVRVLGYRLSPGLAGAGTFAFEVKGDAPVTIPAGHPLKADLAEVTTQVDFETSTECVAQPALGKFHLYRERNYSGTLAGRSKFEITAVDGETDSLSLTALGLKKGDKLVLVPGETMWSSPGTTYTAQSVPQFLTVTKVTTTLGRVIVEIEGTLTSQWSSTATAYVLGRNFRHFGHSAPPKYVVPTSTGASVSTTSYDRGLDHDCTEPTAVSPSLDTDLIPLDQEVGDLALGSQLLVIGQVSISWGSTRDPFAVVRTIASATAGPATLGNLSGPSTHVRFTQDLIRNPAASTDPYADIRGIRIHELKSPALTISRVATHPSGNLPASGNNLLFFYGLQKDAALLAGRRLFFRAPDGRTADVVCTSTAMDFFGSVATAHIPRMCGLDFAPSPAGFTYADFDETNPTVEVFGNLVDVTQGKTERDVPLGNGDARLSFQTFKLPKAPLTYFLSASATPPEAPELSVWVNGREWTRVDSFFGRSAEEQVWLVREDADGNSYVQFGDGETGARLPSGLQNVVARYRTGSGAYGPAKDGSSPTTPIKLLNLHKLHLLGEVSGGSAAETEDKAREAAPGKIQGLGRLVSIRDYETEVLGIAGVITATAAWGLVDNTPAVLLCVLLEAGREGEFGSLTDADTSSIADTIASYQRCRGSNRFPVVVRQAFYRYAWTEITYAADPALIPADVEAAIHAALGLAGDEATERSGLFGLRARRLGQPEYATSIEAAVQRVAGVRWCRVTASGLFAAHLADPAAQALPTAPRNRSELLSCGEDELLQLHTAHIVLTSAPTGTVDPCA